MNSGLVVTIFVVVILALVAVYLRRPRPNVETREVQKHLAEPHRTESTKAITHEEPPREKDVGVAFSITFDGPRKYQQTDEDIDFEQRVREAIGEQFIEKAFYVKVVGVTFRNGDGSRRLPIIRKCQMFESLQLRHDTSDTRFPEAVGVHRKDGGQLGFLDARLAAEVLRAARAGYCWFPVFRGPNQHEGRTVGGIVYLMKLTGQYAIQHPPKADDAARV